MKIAYVITRAEMGGAQVHVLDLIKGFVERHTPVLITGERGYLTEECEQLGVECRIIPDLVQPLRPWQDFKAFVNTARLLRRMAPDLVHCHTSKAGIIGRLAAWVCRIPAVFTAHTWSFADGTSPLWRLVGKPSERVSALWSHKIISVSESNRALAINLGIVPASKIATIHNGIEDTPWQASHSREGVPEIVMVARFADQKNHAELVNALLGLDEPYHVSLVGDGPTRAGLEATVRDSGLQGKVSFLGIRKDTNLVLSRADIFVLATKWEGFPISILEAMRAGLPVIATDVDGVREAVADGNTGLLYSRGRVDQLRKLLRTLLTDPERRVSLGRAGRQRYEANFTRDVMLARTEGVYREILEPRYRQDAALVEG